MQWSRDGEVQLVGKYPSTGIYFNGSMAHVHFTDGYAYDASTFGETDSTTGIWVSKTNPSVTYGTNGFFLKFGININAVDTANIINAKFILH